MGWIGLSEFWKKKKKQKQKQKKQKKKQKQKKHSSIMDIDMFGFETSIYSKQTNLFPSLRRHQW